MPQRKLFLTSISATRKTNEIDFEVRTTSMIIVSSSSDDALLSSKERALKEFLATEGWDDHKYDVKEFPEALLALIRDVLDNPYGAEDAPTEFIM